jgi:hypothetical protein
MALCSSSEISTGFKTHQNSLVAAKKVSHKPNEQFFTEGYFVLLHFRSRIAKIRPPSNDSIGSWCT